jgi:coenzyme PQQ precursor peptide PqqA
MIRRIRTAPGVLHGGGVHHRSFVMKWETPQATDFRFGMEITMYIAKR